MRLFYFIFVLLLLSVCLQSATADYSENILEDRTGDGLVKILAFGDSITKGLGDETNMGGYPPRLMELLKVPVDSEGVAGEAFCSIGYKRFPRQLLSSDADIVLIFEGANDARIPETDDTYQRRMQRVINVALTLGRLPVLVTLPQPSGYHLLLAPYTPGYSSVLRALSVINDNLPVVDLEQVWGTTCVDKGQCELFNIPEGLHPNSTGYTAVSQAMAASLLGIDIFKSNGARKLADALGVPVESIIVQPAPEK